MKEVGAQHTFAPEADLLRNTLRSVVVRIGDQLEPLQPEVVECLPGEKPKRACRDTSSASFGGAPVPDVAGTRLIDGHPDRSDDISTFGDRVLLLTNPRDLSPNEGACVFVRIRTRDDGNPLLDLGVTTRCDDRRHVVQRPSTQLDISVL